MVKTYKSLDEIGQPLIEITIERRIAVKRGFVRLLDRRKSRRSLAGATEGIWVREGSMTL